MVFAVDNLGASAPWGFFMLITEIHLHEAVLLSLEGHLDFSSRPQLMKAIHSAIRGHQAHVIVDLAHIVCTDTAAMGMLVIAYQKLTQHHRRFSLLAPSPSLNLQLQSIQFPRLIPVYTSLSEALSPRVYPFSVV